MGDSVVKKSIQALTTDSGKSVSGEKSKYMKPKVFPTVGLEPKVIVLKLTNNLRHKVNLEVAAEIVNLGTSVKPSYYQ